MRAALFLCLPLIACAAPPAPTPVASAPGPRIALRGGGGGGAAGGVLTFDDEDDEPLPTPAAEITSATVLAALHVVGLTGPLPPTPPPPVVARELTARLIPLEPPRRPRPRFESFDVRDLVDQLPASVLNQVVRHLAPPSDPGPRSAIYGVSAGHLVASLQPGDVERVTRVLRALRRLYRP